MRPRVEYDSVVKKDTCSSGDGPSEQAQREAKRITWYVCSRQIQRWPVDWGFSGRNREGLLTGLRLPRGGTRCPGTRWRWWLHDTGNVPHGTDSCTSERRPHATGTACQGRQMATRNSPAQPRCHPQRYPWQPAPAQNCSPSSAYPPARGLLVPQHHARGHLAPLQHRWPQAPRGFQTLKQRGTQSEPSLGP